MTDFWSGRKVLVTGGAGFLGSRVVSRLRESGVPESYITVPRSAECDLRVWENCVRSTMGQDMVIHLAGKVGGMNFSCCIDLAPWFCFEIGEAQRGEVRLVVAASRPRTETVCA